MAEISPGVGEVVVKVLFAGINGGCETFRARGDHIFAGNRQCRNGFPLGAEGSGIVVALGPGVVNVALGSHVSFLGSAFAEYVRLRADGLIVVPEATAETAALRISGVTACGVLHTGKAKAGDVVLITAAAGASGHFAVQLARQAGCTVVGTCSSDEKARCAVCIPTALRLLAGRRARHRATRARAAAAAAGRLLCDLGCDDIINVAKRDLPAAVHRRHPGGVDVLLDHVGGPLLAAGLACLREGGRAVLVGYIRPARSPPLHPFCTAPSGGAGR
jgi:NADPH:quinone reductase-like Zn-dependent oxidoreductase